MTDVKTAFREWSDYVNGADEFNPDTATELTDELVRTCRNVPDTEKLVSAAEYLRQAYQNGWQSYFGPRERDVVVAFDEWVQS